MHRRQLLALAATANAGCLRLTGDETPTAGSGSTSTTAAAIEEGSEQPSVTDPAGPTETAAVSYPLGLSSTGVDNAGFLFSANVDALHQTSFRAKWVKLDRSSGRFKWQKEYLADGQFALGRWTGMSGGEVAIYRYPGGNYWRENLGNRYTYGNEQPTNQGYEPVVWGIELNPLLHAGDWDAPTRVNDRRPAIWELTTDAVAASTPVPGYHLGEVISIESASVRVDERGIIRAVVAQYRIQERNGEEIAYDIDYRVDSIGEVTVSEPSWLPTAKDQAPSISASLTKDRRFVTARVETGNRIEPGSTVAVVGSDPSAFYLNLDDPLEPGVTAYLYKSQASSNGQISRGSRPTDADPTELTSSYVFNARRKATHYIEPVDISVS